MVVHCGECIYFNRFEVGQTQLGYCQINAPIIIQGTGNKNGSFPIMNESGWCGEGELR